MVVLGSRTPAPVVPFYVSAFGPIPLYEGGAYAPSALDAKVVASWNAIHVLFRPNPPRGSLRYVRSLDEGLSFSPGTLIYDGSPLSFHMATDFVGTLAVGWFPDWGNDVYFRLSYDNGQTFSQPQNLSNSRRVIGLVNPVFDVQGVLHVIWGEGTDRPSESRMMYAKSNLDISSRIR